MTSATASPRRAFTLTEALVVIAILTVLMALALPAIQRARAASSRILCSNNLRGIGTALHHYHIDHAHLPVGNYTRATTDNDPRVMLSWMALCLPYVEEGSLWTSAVGACAQSPDPWKDPPHTPLARVVALYRCPLDDRLSSPLTDADGITAAYTSYIGVRGDRKVDGVMAWPGIKFAQVVDGLSHTLMVGERPPPDTLQAGPWYPNIWFGDGVYGKFRGPDGTLDLHCKVDILYTPSKHMPAEKGEYWRSGDRVRIKATSQGRWEEILVENNVQRAIASLSGHGTKGRVHATLCLANKPLTCNAWSLGLLSLYSPDSTWLPLRQLLKLPHQAGTARWVALGQDDCVHLEITHEKARLELWFDPKANYMVRKLVQHMLTSDGPRNYVGVNEVVRFREVAPGIFFPEEIRSSFTSEDKPATGRTVIFSDITVNKPAKPEVFKLRYPQNAQMADLIEGIVYWVGEDGTKIKPVTDREGKIQKVSITANVPGSSRTSVTPAEPNRTTTFVVSATVVAAALIIGYWLYYRRRLALASFEKPAGD